MRIRNGYLYSGCKNRCVISIGLSSVKCAWLIMRICAFVMCIIIFIHRVRHLITNLLLLDWIITYCCLLLCYRQQLHAGVLLFSFLASSFPDNFCFKNNATATYFFRFFFFIPLKFWRLILFPLPKFTRFSFIFNIVSSCFNKNNLTSYVFSSTFFLN